MNINKLWIGFVAGMVLPVVAFALFYMYSFKSLALSDFLLVVKKMDILTQTLTFCVLPSFLLFFFFHWKQHNKAAQGSVLATLVYTLLLVIVNF